MIVADRLRRDLQRRLPILEEALRAQAEDTGLRYDAELRAEWRRAHEAGRIAAPYEQWRGDQVTQAAVAWLLAMVFLRFCEDNGLIDDPYITGPGDRAAVATERQHAYLTSAEHREETDREWVVAGIEALCDAKGTTDNVMRRLFDPVHNPMWLIDPPADAITGLLRFWRERDASGALIHDFEDKDWNTRFLGDLYQELSEHAKKTYALLQTPEFVEEFILDRTLEPATDDFGLEPENVRLLTGERIPDGLRLVDPTCGSGHFLLGAFHRLLAKWNDRAPGRDVNERIAAALRSVHGVDKNPFAVAIARFRLALAAMRAEHKTRLADSSNFEINVAVGDSLLHGRGATGVTDDLFDQADPFYFRTEDVREYMASCDILGVNSYHVVVGNPPYITVKDKRENENYRKAYASCKGTYALSVPFAERFFKLARTAGAGRRDAGHVGQITANSFMKREFGKRLIEEFFQAKAHLTEVIDTSGAYIPGHGTPTVILIGRYYVPNMGQTVRAVLGVRGEPGIPSDPANGRVWRAIVDHIERPGYEDEWVSVTDLPRIRLRKHPWSLSGGGADHLLEIINRVEGRLSGRITEIGFGAVTREDSAFMVGAGTLERRGVSAAHRRPMVEGDATRDWRITDPVMSLWTYDPETLKPEIDHGARELVWPYRCILQGRVAYGKTQLERGLEWFEYSMFFAARYRRALSITFAFVTTHNHFVLDRGGKVFNRSAPVIKLPEGAGEDEHLELLGVLNSSTACFWLKQVCHDKGNRGEGGGITSSGWERFFEFTGTKLQEFPLPPELPLERARELDAFAQRLAECEPSAIASQGTPTIEALAEAEREYTSTRARMIALQEELDWDVYRRYGLLDNDEAAELIADPVDVPEIKLGERAFEIVLARSGAETEWFNRHRSKPVTDIPAHWPEAYRRVVEARIAVIEKRPKTIGLIERPECKRRWLDEPWDKKVKAALRTWLLDRCEDRGLWFDANGAPEPMTVNRLADKLRGDADVAAVAALYAGGDTDLAKVIADVTATEHVPYLARLRYKATGLRKRERWEKVWEKQREEDATGARLDIDPPPRYAPADFAKPAYWHNRGKLDVPKERFISYPDAGPEGDRSPLLGWAGWDDAQRAHVLAVLAPKRDTGNADADRKVIGPILDGLAEVMPWVIQWHGERDAYGSSPAEDYAAELADLRTRYGLGAAT